MISNPPEWWDGTVDRIREDYFKRFKGLPVSVAVSGGRTSGTMACLIEEALEPDVRVVYGFRNTGFEDVKTLKYVNALDHIYHIPVVWTEYVAPPTGARPVESTYRIITYETADRGGRPYLDLLNCLATFRAEVKKEDPVGPTPKNRICTAHLKIATGWRWTVDVLGRDFVDAVGLRADEPTRVYGLKGHRKGAEPWCPLAVAGITKPMILEFWTGRRGDLELVEPWGNCSHCFLKDESDLADLAVADPEGARLFALLEAQYGTPCPIYRPVSGVTATLEVAEAWGRARGWTLKGLQLRPSKDAPEWLFHTPPTFRGQGATYSQIQAQIPERMRIRAAIAAGEKPSGNQRLIRSETRRERQSFSCGCEGAGKLAAMAIGDDQ